MPKRVPTVSTVVIRKDETTKKNRRITVEPGKAFDFTQDEIDDLNRIHPGALRKPVNESTNDAAGTDETSPEKTVKPTAAKANKVPAKKKAAQADSTSDEATGEGDESEADDAQGDGTGEGSGDAGEDDDI